MVIAQTLFKALKRRLPGCILDIAGPPWAPAILERMPEVDHSIVVDIAHGELGLGKRWSLGRQLRENSYDQAFLMSRSLKSALIPWFAGIPLRTGYRGEFRRGIVNDIRTLNTTDLKRKAQHYVALSLAPDEHPRNAARFDYPSLSIDEANRDALVRKFNLSLQRPVVAIAPGAAYGPIKRWPAHHYAELAGKLADHDYGLWIFGNEDDQVISKEIASNAPEHCIDFCGQTRLVDVIDLMSLTQTVVGNDTGLTHIASAVVPHVVALYGPTHPNFAPPLCQHGICLSLNRGCTLRNAKTDSGGHARSLHDLPVDDVVRACLAPEDTSISSRYSVQLRSDLPTCQ